MLTYIKSSGAAATAHSEPGWEPVPVLRAARPDDNQLEYLFTLNKCASQSVVNQYNGYVHVHTIQISIHTRLERSCKDRRRNLSEQERTRTSSLQHAVRQSKSITLCFNVRS